MRSVRIAASAPEFDADDAGAPASSANSPAEAKWRLIDRAGDAFSEWRRGRPFFLAPVDLLRDGAFAGQSLPLRVLLMMLATADGEGNCSPRQAEMAAHLSVTAAPLSRAIEWLALHGYVRKVVRHRRGWSYRITAHELPSKANHETPPDLPWKASHDLPSTASYDLPPKAISISIKTKEENQEELALLERETRGGERANPSDRNANADEPDSAKRSRRRQASKPVRFFSEDEPMSPDFHEVASKLQFGDYDAIEAEWQNFRDWHLKKGQGTASMKASTNTWIKKAFEFRRASDAKISSKSADYSLTAEMAKAETMIRRGF